MIRQERNRAMKTRHALGLLLILLVVPKSFAQNPPVADPLDGLWQGYDGEWRQISNQLMELAQATPEKNFAWRPAPGVRSTSEVYMHIAQANFLLLGATGPKIPDEMLGNVEKTITSKDEVIDWLRRSLEAVKQAHLNETSTHLALRVKFQGHPSTVDNMYLRIIVHDSEHMGQLIAYARMTGVVPPWSK
jgi:uncharacterized damage-inducible protein DinB